MNRSDVCVSADWVQMHLYHPGFILAEICNGTSAYDGASIRGAVKIDWQDLQEPALCDRAGFEALLLKWRIAPDDMVILYSGNNRLAVYSYWYFRHHGHQSVRLLLESGRKNSEPGASKLVTHSPSRLPAASHVRGTPVPRPAWITGDLTRRLRNGAVRPAGQVLRFLSTRVLALLATAANGDEAATAPPSPDGIDTRAHDGDEAKDQGIASSMRFGPVIYSLIGQDARDI